MSYEKTNNKIKIFKGGLLIDGTGAVPLNQSVVVVEGTKIIFIGREQDEYPYKKDAVEIHHLYGKVIMPGLIDAHIHLWGVRTMDYYHRLVVHEYLGVIRAAEDVGKLLSAGFTSVRCCGGNKAIHLRQAVLEGTLPGPRIVAANLSITQTGGFADIHFLPLDEVKRRRLKCRIADGPDECRKAAREQLREGADFLKIATTGGTMSQKDGPFECQMTREEIQAVVEEAERKGSYVAAHAHNPMGVIHALRGGVRTIEHGKNLDKESCQMMKDHGAILVSTLSISDQIAARGKESGVSPWGLKKGIAGRESSRRSIKMAYDMGVKVAMGTDYSGAPMLPHGRNARELELLVDIGFTPMDAIVSSTKIAAEALGVAVAKETGTLEAGKNADLIVVEGNPIDDIRILQDHSKIRMVVKGGSLMVER